MGIVINLVERVGVSIADSLNKVPSSWAQTHIDGGGDLKDRPDATSKEDGSSY